MWQGVLKVILFSVAISLVIGANARADTVNSNVTFDHTVTNGTMQVMLSDSANNPILVPHLTFPTAATALVCEDNYNDVSKAVKLGTPNQNLAVSVGRDAAPNGWQLSIAPTDGHNAAWKGTKLSTPAINYNDLDGDGCKNSRGTIVDGKSTVGGVMKVSPSKATLYAGCPWPCSVAGMSKGEDTVFSNQVDSALIVKQTANVPWMGNINGTLINQTWPAALAPDNYSLSMTLTMVSL